MVGPTWVLRWPILCLVQRSRPNSHSVVSVVLCCLLGTFKARRSSKKKTKRAGIFYLSSVRQPTSQPRANQPAGESEKSPQTTECSDGCRRKREQLAAVRGCDAEAYSTVEAACINVLCTTRLSSSSASASTTVPSACIGTGRRRRLDGRTAILHTYR